MSLLYFSREGLRQVDRQSVERYGLPLLALMENAGRAVATQARSMVSADASILVVSGPGHNGGDALVAARHLHNQGYRIRLVLTSTEYLVPPTQTHLQVLCAMGILPTVLGDSSQGLTEVLSEAPELILDGLLGTGLSRPVQGFMRELIEAINQAAAQSRGKSKVLAIDLPSGLDADGGEALGTAIRATHTVSFCGGKLGFTNPASAPYVGSWSIGDIGAPVELLRACAASSLR